jgi:hypothetical protein
MFTDTPKSVRIWQSLFAAFAVLNLPGVLGSDSVAMSWLGVVAFALVAVSYQFRHTRLVRATRGEQVAASPIETALLYAGVGLVVLRIVLRISN